MDVRYDGDVDNMDRRESPKLNLSYDPIPVRLRVIGHAVRVASYIDLFDPIVDANRDAVFSRCEVPGEIVLVRGAEAVLRSDFPVINPELCLPMTSFEEKGNVFSLPLLRYYYVLLIPRSSHV